MSDFFTTFFFISFTDPIVEIPVTWPQGTYGLPKPHTVGCPNSHFTWATGWRFHDTEDVGPDNFWSNPCHLEGPYWGNDAYQNFCMKTVNEEDIYEWTWPAGQYCIFRKGGACPSGTLIPSKIAKLQKLNKIKFLSQFNNTSESV